jgi:hypothetical protein
VKISRLVRRPSRVLPALVIAALIAPEARAEARLRWNFVRGKEYHYTLTQKTTSVISPAGPKPSDDTQAQTIKSTLNMVFDMTFTPKEIARDGSASLVLSFDRIRMDLAHPLGKLDFDSASGRTPEGPMVVLQTMIGTPIELRMSTRGEVLDVKVPAKIGAALRAAGPGSQGTANLATAEGLKNMLGQTFPVFPEETIDPGKQWGSADPITSSSEGTVASSRTYTYKGPTQQGGKAVEEIDVALKTSIKASAKSDVPVKLRLQEGKGAYHFDNADGSLQGVDLSDRMQLTAIVKGREILRDTEATSTMRAGPPASDPGQAK